MLWRSKEKEFLEMKRILNDEKWSFNANLSHCFSWNLYGVARWLMDINYFSLLRKKTMKRLVYIGKEFDLKWIFHHLLLERDRWSTIGLVGSFTFTLIFVASQKECDRLKNVKTILKNVAWKSFNEAVKTF